MKPILDLDDIIESSIAFKLLGVTRHLKPIKLAEFLSLANAFSKIESEPSRDAKELARQYFEIFDCCIDIISIEDVLRMTQAQCAALLSMITRRMQGETAESMSDESDLKKKSLLSQ